MLGYTQGITINGKVETADSTWYVIKTDDNTTQMVSSSLLSTTKPQPQKPSGNTGNTGSTTQPSTGGGSSSNGNGLEADGEMPPEFSGGGVDWSDIDTSWGGLH